MPGPVFGLHDGSARRSWCRPSSATSAPRGRRTRARDAADVRHVIASERCAPTQPCARSRSCSATSASTRPSATRASPRTSCAVRSSVCSSRRRPGTWMCRAGEHCAHRRRPPLASALTGRDTVMVQPAGDRGEARAASAFSADAIDDGGRECGFASGPFAAALRGSRLVAPFGEVTLEFPDRDQPRTPLRLHGRDCRHDAPVERREAHAEQLRRLIARVDERRERPVVGRGRRATLLLLASSPLPARCHGSAPSRTPNSNAEACVH